MCVCVCVIGGQTVRGFWNQQGAEVLKLSLAKAVYDKLFSWIILYLNRNIEPEGGFKQFMGEKPYRNVYI